MTSAVAELLPRLAPIVARMASQHDGERLACIAALERVLAGQRLDFNDFAEWLASPPPTASRRPRRSAKHGKTRVAVPDVVFNDLRAVIASDLASEREAEIAESLVAQAYRLGGLTEKQLALATDIIAKVRARAEGTG